MENIEVLIYILFGVIWIISRILKANKDNQAKRNAGPPPRPDIFASDERRKADRRPKTIEEILMEMAGEKPVYEEDEEDYEPYNPVSEKKPAEQKAYEPAKNVVPDKYQNFTGAVSNTQYQSLEDYVGESLLKEEDEGRFEEYEISQKQTSSFAEILKDKDEFKKAIILSEVLQRKYE